MHDCEIQPAILHEAGSYMQYHQIYVTAVVDAEW